MNKFHYENRCLCNEEFLPVKEFKLNKISEGKPLQYPRPEDYEIPQQTQVFKIKCEEKLSSTAKNILNSFHNKYIYYAIDDILNFLKTDRHEQEKVLNILYSPLISLQNNFSINFFDIWIQEVYIEEISNFNKFLKTEFRSLKVTSYITIKFFYKTKIPSKKTDSLW